MMVYVYMYCLQISTSSSVQLIGQHLKYFYTFPFYEMEGNVCNNTSVYLKHVIGDAPHFLGHYGNLNVQLQNSPDNPEVCKCM
jgi:hypothetical protein